MEFARVAKNNLFSLYIRWHFFDVPKTILKGWWNFLRYNANFFSLKILLKTFFAHWHRLASSYGKRFDPKRYFETFILNMMSRIVGAIIRSVVLMLGIFVEMCVCAIGAIIFVGWFFLPLFLIGGGVAGLVLILF